MDKYQKALENLRQFNKHSFPVASLHFWFQSQLVCLQELIDKETPMKPIDYDIDEETPCYDWVCPNCERFHMTTDAPKYCSYCGQKIDWSEHDAGR